MRRRLVALKLIVLLGGFVVLNSGPMGRSQEGTDCATFNCTSYYCPYDCANTSQYQVCQYTGNPGQYDLSYASGYWPVSQGGCACPSTYNWGSGSQPQYQTFDANCCKLPSGSCSSSPDCCQSPSAQSCIGNTCCISLGGDCTQYPSYCCPGSHCDTGNSNLCVRDSCADPPASCSIPSDCCSGFCYSNACSSCIPDTYSCANNPYSCCGGVCSSGTCHPCSPIQEGCSSPNDCCDPTASCVDSTCCYAEGQGCLTDDDCCGTLYCDPEFFICSVPR